MPNTARKTTETLRASQNPLSVPTDLKPSATHELAKTLNGLLGDAFALYLKTKNFHWHMSGPHFRDYHLLLDEQADQIFAMTDPLAERVRKIGEITLKSVGDISRHQTIKDNNAAFVDPSDMLEELLGDNVSVAAALRKAHELCDDKKDVATASLIEVWLDETERRAWFLAEASRSGDSTGH